MQVKKAGPLSGGTRSLKRKRRHGYILNFTGCEGSRHNNICVVQGYSLVWFLVLVAVSWSCFVSSLRVNQEEFWKNISQLWG